MKPFALIILLASGLSSCTSELYVPTATDATPTVTFEELQKGRRKYVEKCSSCHALYLPEKYSSAQWRSILDDMEDEAKMNPDEKDLIVKYLTKGKE
jgi:hypothetical protein